ncbi:MAG: hypothetical protein ABFC89_12770 [Methanospirillum sp.]
MPYTDRNGIEMKQFPVWIPMQLYHLVKADHLNVSQFVREQLEILYSDESLEDSLNTKFRLVRGARESSDRQREVAAGAAANRERLRDLVRQMRDDRIATATAAEQTVTGIRDALAGIVGEDVTGRYRRMLPENDPNGDRIDMWEDLLRHVSRACGQEVEPAAVAAELRRMTAGA